jgi:predicted DNA-binding protein
MKKAYAGYGTTRGTVITTRLPPELVERLDALGKADGITRSFAARRAIEAGLKKLQPRAKAKRPPKV